METTDDVSEFEPDDRLEIDRALDGLDRAIGLLPLRNQVLFPFSQQSVDVAREKSVALVESMSGDAQPIVAAFPQVDPATDEPGPEDLHLIGVVARVLETVEQAKGNYTLTLRGLARVRLDHLTQENPFLSARVSRPQRDRSVPRPDESGEADAALEALGARLRDTARLAGLPRGAEAGAETVDGPGRLADRVSVDLEASIGEKASILQAVDVEQRIGIVLRLLERELGWRREREALVLPTGADLRQLWPLDGGADERIAGSVDAGDVSRDEAERIARFAENGYVIWERLIEPELVDALLADVRGIRDHPGHFLLTDHKRGRPFRFSGPDFDSFESIFDTYVNFESARRVCFHPTIVRFLELLFDERPVAIQQLLFQRSNAHPMHQDTAYVCVAEPLCMVATWIALEDVVAGRGELTYYEGSHRISPYFYKDGSKRFHPEHDDADAARRDILERCRARGCEKRDFIAKKGDVFLWAADLVHGSNPRTRPEAETRMSCVTHYCPETTQPLYFWVVPEHRELQAYGDRALIASSHYRLPKGEGLARPSFKLPLPC